MLRLLSSSHLLKMRRIARSTRQAGAALCNSRTMPCLVLGRALAMPRPHINVASGEHRSRTAGSLQAHSACRCQGPAIQHIRLGYIDAKAAGS